MAYIKDEEINEIRSLANIVDIISSYINVSPKGKNYVALCPFHNDHSPSLIISSEKQIFNCFTCRTGGNVYSFVMKYENVSFLEAIKIVADKVGYNLNIKNLTTSIDSKNSLDYEIYQYASKYYINNINTTDGQDAKKYLHMRGIDDFIIKEFKIGLSLNQKDTFYKLASKKGWDLDTLDKLGLINKVGTNIYDTFINRIMIPIENLKGEIVGFTGRIFNDDNTAKYLNTKETDIFKKSGLLFNYHNAKNYIREKQSVIVVEGNMDAIKLSSKGFKNVVALMGVALSNEQIDILKRLKATVILMLDNDKAGLDATLKNGEVLNKVGIDTKIVRLTEAKDPDEYLEKYGVQAMEKNIAGAIKYIDFKIELLKENKNLNNLDDLIIYIKEVLCSINSEDNLTKEIVLSKISNDYKIDIDVLKKSLGSALKVEKKQKSKEKPIKISKYHKASHKVLFYMLVDKKYISMYKNTLGFFKERMERVLASEIEYYAKGVENINIADFTTNVLKKEDEYELLQIILSENGNTSISDEEFTSCVKAILNIYKKEKIEKIKEEISKEFDQSKKEQLIEKLIDLKRKW